jgi:sugar lactone lactonase YvrE
MKLRLLCLALSAASVVHAATTAPEITIPGEHIFPESLTSSADGTVIFGSIGARTVFRAKPGSATAEPWIKPGTDGMRSVLGVFADDKSNTLYACSGGFGPPPPGEAPYVPTLFAFDLKTGEPKGHYVFPNASGGCNDIAVGSDGTAYITDTGNALVLRLKMGAKDLEVWAGQDGEFGAMNVIVDGIAVLGERVIVNALVSSKLFSVPIGKDGKAGTVTEIKLDKPISRPDGMRSYGKNTLFIAESGAGGRVSRVDLKGDNGKTTLLKEGIAGGPVSVTVVGKKVYVLEGQLGFLMGFAPKDAKIGPFRATAIPIK